MIDYPLLLTARNYLRLSNQCPYTDYSHVLTIDPVADMYMSARNVKSATIDRIEYVTNARQWTAAASLRIFLILKSASNRATTCPHKSP